MDIGLGTLRGWVRKQFAQDYGEGQQPVALSTRGALLAAQELPERAELVRLGGSYGAQIPTGSAFTFVAAWPTTRAELVLWNGEATGGKSYVIDRCWMANITSMAAAQPIALLGQLAPNTLSIAAPTDNAAVLRQSLNGNRGTYAGKGRLMVANTAFALANQWFTLGTGLVPAPTTNLGCSIEAHVYGKYIVAPSAAFCLAGLAGTAAGTALIGVEWHEVQIPVY